MDEGPMNINPNLRRRRAQLILLLAAIVMIALGFTVFSKWLTGLRLLAYCLFCMALTLTAMLLAVRDLRDIRRQNREEKIGLLEKAVDGVTSEVKEARGKRRAGSAR